MRTQTKCIHFIWFLAYDLIWAWFFAAFLYIHLTIILILANSLAEFQNIFLCFLMNLNQNECHNNAWNKKSNSHKNNMIKILFVYFRLSAGSRQIYLVKIFSFYTIGNSSLLILLKYFSRKIKLEQIPFVLVPVAILSHSQFSVKHLQIRSEI